MAKSHRARILAKSRRASRARAQARATPISTTSASPPPNAPAFHFLGSGADPQKVIPTVFVPRQRTTTDETNQSEVSAVTQESSSSSGASFETSQLPGTMPSTGPYRSSVDLYNPESYKCVDYDEGYVYFDGRPGSDRDQRFVIDLEHGSMDRLPDVRPYLYYVGYHSSRRTNCQGQIENLAPSEIEQAYVVAGRQYLMDERKRGRGYFLKARNWASLNTGSYACFPFQRLVGSDNEADQGFEFAHDIAEYEDDCCISVIKTNVRTPLPRGDMIWVRPGDDDWDRFIQWVYEPDLHGAMKMVESRWAGWEVERERRAQGFGDGWMRDVVTEEDA